VKTGISADELTEIVDGVQEGELVRAPASLMVASGAAPSGEREVVSFGADDVKAPGPGGGAVFVRRVAP
jgi:hypothetical protein